MPLDGSTIKNLRGGGGGVLNNLRGKKERKKLVIFFYNRKKLHICTLDKHKYMNSF